MNPSNYFGGGVSSWKEQAKALFFVEHLCVNEIAEIVNRRRETVSRFITDCEGYIEEMNFRKRESSLKRKDYQRDWDRQNRPNRYYNAAVTKDTLLREHETAAMILSSERY